MSHATGLSALLPYVLAVFAAWLASGLFAGYRAFRKDRCGWCWVIGGVLFGPFALIAIAFVPPKVRVARAADTATPATPGLRR
jgi:hypothetical protein